MPTCKQDDDDDQNQDGCCNIVGNILDELKRQDMIEENQRTMAEQLIGYSSVAGSSMSMPKTNEKQQKHEHSDQQHNQKSNKDDLTAGRKFGLEKKFKEDQVSHSNQQMKTVVGSQTSKPISAA